MLGGLPHHMLKVNLSILLLALDRQRIRLSLHMGLLHHALHERYLLICLKL